MYNLNTSFSSLNKYLDYTYYVSKFLLNILCFILSYTFLYFAHLIKFQRLGTIFV